MAPFFILPRNAVREVEALSGLEHRNIVRYFTCWEEESGYQVYGSSDGCNSSSGSVCSPQLTSLPLLHQSAIVLFLPFSSCSGGSSASCYLYIQMELCAKETLTKWISAENSKSQNVVQRRQESLQIALQLTSGVNYIHSRRLIHRDLKVRQTLSHSYFSESLVHTGIFQIYHILWLLSLHPSLITGS